MSRGVPRSLAIGSPFVEMVGDDCAKQRHGGRFDGTKQRHQSHDQFITRKKLSSIGDTDNQYANCYEEQNSRTATHSPTIHVSSPGPNLPLAPPCFRPKG